MGEQEDTKKPKTMAIGVLSKEAASQLNGWQDYTKKAEALTKARKDSEAAKDVIREGLRSALIGKPRRNGTRLDNESYIDFVVENDGSMRVFENLEKGKGRTRSADLSEFFSRPTPRAIKA